MNRKSRRQRRTLRQQCFQLTLLTAVTGVAATVITYRRHIKLLAGIRRLRAATNGSKVLVRPVEELLREADLTRALAKAGWPLDSQCVGGTEDGVPFVAITLLPLNGRVKLSTAANKGFVVDAYIDPNGVHYNHESLPQELQAKNVPYNVFSRHMEKSQETTTTINPNPAPV